MEVKDIVVPLATLVIGGGLAWLRFRKKDSAEVQKTSAEAKKVYAEADNTIADGFKKLMALQEAELFKKIGQLEEQERALRFMKDELKKAELAFVEKESTYQKMILELTTKVHQLENEIKSLQNATNR